MAIDFEGTIYPALIQSVRDSIGSSLYQFNTPNGAYPAIIRKRSDGPRPQLPYVTVDIENIRLPSGWLLNTEVEDTGSGIITTHQILYEVFVCFECYGDNSTPLLQQYHSEFNVPDGVRSQLKDDAGMSSQYFGQVVSIPEFISTNYEERAKLEISFYVHDVITRTSTYVEAINGSGTFVDFEGNVLKTININVP